MTQTIFSTRTVLPIGVWGLLLAGCTPTQDNATTDDASRATATDTISNHKGGPIPRGITFELANGAQASGSRNLPVTVQASDDVGVTHMCISLARRRCLRWRPYQENNTIRLSRRAGRVEFQALFRDADGNVS